MATTRLDFSDPILGFRPVYRRYANPDAIIWHVYRLDRSGRGVERVTGYADQRSAEDTARTCRERSPGHVQTWIVPCRVTIDPPERFADEAALHRHFEARP